MSPSNAHESRFCRYLVIGSGIAGLQFALLAAASGRVQVITKKESQESNSNYAQGGIAAVVAPGDDFELHVQDTLAAGDGLCKETVVRDMVAAGPSLIQRLLGYGIDFSRDEGDDSGTFALGQEGGHSRRRILHCQDLTGKVIERNLLSACQSHPNIDLLENHMGLELILGRDVGLGPEQFDRVVGCLVLDRDAGLQMTFLADAVILASGGCGKVYSYTSNPDIATGDGLAMAFRAGAKLMNLEFVQFHPTCLFHPDAKSFLISEAVRGEGAFLINQKGERFMSRYHPQAELAPRDIVARSIDHEMKLKGDPCAFLDLRHLDRQAVEERFPHLVRICENFGIDMAGEPVPVVPAAHYMCGGVAVDMDARSSLAGFFAIGEAACSGAHGANRLASNSLLEAVFFAERCARAVAQEPVVFPHPADVPKAVKFRVPKLVPAAQAMVLEHDWDQVRRVMWDYVGVVREQERLDIALARLRGIRKTVEELYGSGAQEPDIVELRNIALLGELIVLCARSRRESRGLHFTPEFPEHAAQACDTVIHKDAMLASQRCSQPGAANDV